MKRNLIATLILAILALNLTGCANHTKTFEKYIRNGNYADAITLYQDKLMDNSNNYITCQELVHAYLAESLSGYSQGNLSQREMEAVLHTMEKLEDHLYLVDDLEDGYTTYAELTHSKSDFRKAVESQKSGQLEDALDYFSDVIPEDTENYTKARKNMEELKKQILRESRDAIILAYESKDYPAVFLAYREAEQNPCITVTEDLTEIYEAASLEYLQAIKAQAQQAFNGAARDYNAALEVLRNAKAATSEEAGLLAELEALAETYQAYIPVNLTELDRLQKTSYVDVGSSDSDVYTDINRNSHDKKGVISPTGAWHNDKAESDDEACVTYNLNLDYSTFTATIYRPYVFLTYTGEVPEGRCRVKIYGDDALLYEFSDPGDSGAPWDIIPVNVNVSGVRKLKIVIYGCWNSAGSYTDFPSWNPGICLADCVLQK